MLSGLLLVLATITGCGGEPESPVVLLSTPIGETREAALLLPGAIRKGIIEDLRGKGVSDTRLTFVAEWLKGSFPSVWLVTDHGGELKLKLSARRPSAERSGNLHSYIRKKKVEKRPHGFHVTFEYVLIIPLQEEEAKAEGKEPDRHIYRLALEAEITGKPRRPPKCAVIWKQLKRELPPKPTQLSFLDMIRYAHFDEVLVTTRGIGLHGFGDLGIVPVVTIGLLVLAGIVLLAVGLAMGKPVTVKLIPLLGCAALVLGLICTLWNQYAVNTILATSPSPPSPANLERASTIGLKPLMLGIQALVLMAILYVIGRFEVRSRPAAD
jgi:hypothetical protein